MNAEKLQLKIFAGPAHVEREAFIPVFHSWIKNRVLGDELVIDVANYAHVPQGPGVVLIGHAVDYFMDEGEDRLGLLVNRKRQAPPAGDRLADLFRRTVRVALLLEKEASLAGLRFRTDEWLFRINDRLAAGNDEPSFSRLRPELEGFASKLFGAGASLERVGDSRALFGVRIKVSGAPELPALLERLG